MAKYKLNINYLFNNIERNLLCFSYCEIAYSEFLPINIGNYVNFCVPAEQI